MRKSFLFFAAFLPFFLNAFSLKDKFEKAAQGDYIIAEKDKSYLVLILSHIQENEIILEEIAIPQHLAPKKNWKEWILAGAKGNSSWMLYQIDLSQGNILGAYSKSRNAYLPLENAQTFLTTLLTLPLKEVGKEERKKIGPPPLEGPDMRKIWSPPIPIEGKNHSGRNCDVFKAKWPKDGSELSAKEVELYFDGNEKSFAFPFWMQVIDGTTSYKIRILDSGRNLKKDSPLHYFLKEAPYLFVKNDSGKTVELELILPQGLTPFMLCAVSHEDEKKIPFSFAFKKTSPFSWILSIEKEELRPLKRHHVYSWGVKTEPDLFDLILSQEPFVWEE